MLLLLEIIACFGLSRQFFSRPPSFLIAITQFFPYYALLPQFLLIAIAFRCLKQHDLSPGMLGLSPPALHAQLVSRDISKRKFP
ncbi:hypothetical protein C5Y97_18160 [Blastopirellula marina]|uniref:Uncharacterized protein n=1 Tax=Blastopirellula marina TaxID=124 RepID=A0A2S8FLK0_9BACT|nr:hypothetical protein C5Y98_18150 [Blastopirellula marina]PTL43225.1 hypothetical protein C5Y97_18160 [Blastopirellula marina]